MSLKGRIPIVLISGFLGSGKTTLLNNLIGMYPDTKFGIIVNDFGTLAIDADLIKKSEGNVIRELNNGQIFCSCLSGSFVKSVSDYADLDINYLLVETSGLAKPSSLFDIINEVKKLNEGVFAYYGMICLVDAENYLQISEVLNAVNEQIVYSNMILLNKIDLVDLEKTREIETKILLVNPDAVIIKTEYGNISEEVFPSIQEKENIRIPDNRFMGWGEKGRPVPLVLGAVSPVDPDELDTFIDEFMGSFFRLKGSVLTGSGSVFVDCSMTQKKVSSIDNENSGLVIILPAEKEIVAAVKERALEIFDSVK